MEKERILIDNYGPDQDVFRKSLEMVINKAKELNVSVSFVVPTLNNLDLVEDVLGSKFVKNLKKDKSSILGVQINLMTDITMKKKLFNPIAFCIYSTTNQIESLQKYDAIKFEYYLIWMDVDKEYYKKYKHKIINYKR